MLYGTTTVLDSGELAKDELKSSSHDSSMSVYTIENKRDASVPVFSLM